MLRLAPQGHHLQKGGNGPEEYEDAFASDVAAGRLAIADGASDSYDSGRWARLLVAAFIAGPPPADTAGLRAWLIEPAQAWLAGLNYAALPWNQQAKARLGAHCTFLGVELDLLEPGVMTPDAPCGSWRALAVGDSCLFQIRDGCLLAPFPLARAGAFSSSPPLLTTNPAYRGASLEQLRTARGDLRLGDTLLLATDALAHWLLCRHEQGEQPWCALPPAAEFATFIEELRTMRRLRNDDVTLLVVHFSAEAAPAAAMTTAIVPRRDADRWRQWPC